MSSKYPPRSAAHRAEFRVRVQHQSMLNAIRLGAFDAFMEGVSGPENLHGQVVFLHDLFLREALQNLRTHSRP